MSPNLEKSEANAKLPALLRKSPVLKDISKYLVGCIMNKTKRNK